MIRNTALGSRQAAFQRRDQSSKKSAAQSRTFMMRRYRLDLGLLRHCGGGGGSTILGITVTVIKTLKITSLRKHYKINGQNLTASVPIFCPAHYLQRDQRNMHLIQNVTLIYC
jgi:hypothetical protein